MNKQNTEVKTGDTVKVTAQKYGHKFEIGSLVEVIRIKHNRGFTCRNDQGIEHLLAPDEFEAVDDNQAKPE